MPGSPIKNFSNYRIDKKGNIWSCVSSMIAKRDKKGRILNVVSCISNFKKLKPLSKKSYPMVILCKDGKKFAKTLHRLVAKTFLPNPTNYPCVCHKNNIKTDNRVENLYWGSYSMNIKQSFADGRKHVNKGEESNLSRLSLAQVKLIRLMAEQFLWKQSKIVKILGSIWKINQSTVSRIMSKKRWAHI